MAAVLLVLWVTLQFEVIDWTGLENWARPQAPRLAVLLGAAVFVVVGGWAWWRTPTRTARKPGLSWWVVVAAAMVVAAVAWGATEWLLGEADGATDRGAARVDAIKTGLGIGAGATGIFALLLAVRRQTHQEHTAADTSFDAAEKRVIELYTKAVEQLGSDHSAVRLGGLYALERLAQGNPDTGKPSSTCCARTCACTTRPPATYPRPPRTKTCGRTTANKSRNSKYVSLHSASFANISNPSMLTCCGNPSTSISPAPA
jgi:hypothetical protein